MNTKGRVTSMAERVEIGEHWVAGQNDWQIALALQRPVSTIRKWRRRNQHAGRPGLASQMGRPARGALGQFPGELSDEIYRMRKAHPGWGPLTILVELKKMVVLQDCGYPVVPGLRPISKTKTWSRNMSVTRNSPNPSAKRLNARIRNGKSMRRVRWQSMASAASPLSMFWMCSVV